MAFNVRDIQHEIKLAQKSKLRYRAAASFAASAGGVARQGQAFFSGGDPLSAAASTTVPCLGIILPIVLGFAALAADSLEERWRRKAERKRIIFKFLRDVVHLDAPRTWRREAFS